MSQEDGESLATAQMSMKKGLKMFGDAGVEAVRSEMRQLHERNVMKPAHARELTPDERREALAYLMFLKQAETVREGQGTWVCRWSQTATIH
jgi:hypothetical protein